MTVRGAVRGAAPCLALDIGATKVDAALVQSDGTLVRSEQLLLGDLDEDLLTPIIQMLERVRAEADVAALGVGCAGPMSRNGERVSPLNIPRWRDFPLLARLTGATGLDVFIDGDARALALAEGVYGAARSDESYLSMVVSTGIGGGLVLNDRLVDGSTGNAGHVGHLNVVRDGRDCSCGSRGCLEAEASGSAIEAMTGRAPVEADLPMRERVADLVGRAVGTLSAVLDFERCYIAGSVALGFGDAFFARANAAATEINTMSYSKHLVLSPSGLGSRGPVLGAALVGWRGLDR